MKKYSLSENIKIFSFFILCAVGAFVVGGIHKTSGLSFDTSRQTELLVQTQIIQSEGNVTETLYREYFGDASLGVSCHIFSSLKTSGEISCSSNHEIKGYFKENPLRFPITTYFGIIKKQENNETKETCYVYLNRYNHENVSASCVNNLN